MFPYYANNNHVNDLRFLILSYINVSKTIIKFMIEIYSSL